MTNQWTHKDLEKERIGLKNINKDGQTMEIIEYKNKENVTVLFDDGSIKTCQMGNFRKGSVRSNFFKSMHGVGYNGDGKYAKSIDGKFSRSYNAWRGMMDRCYTKYQAGNNVVYNDCFVCSDWHNFQTFAQWYEENHYEIKNHKMQLDKDILFKGNREYSPSTCMIVPSCINALFIKCDSRRGKYPIGVTYCKTTVYKYRAWFTNQLTKKKSHLGQYETPELAFSAYKDGKEHHIQEVADYYKEEIPKILYDAMYNYEVEITD
jgi:hypothetical protein